ncbi:MAG: Ectoine dioxygenase [Alphaproteobacteria bacterium MarineAlpha9_Bin5]|nr:MAG: Ectoine dioxygenase [Alphaproteobacteria bacterium MarineAlpha9_Bin5]
MQPDRQSSEALPNANRGVGDGSVLSKQQVEFYHEEGYIVVEDVLDKALLTKLREVTDEVTASAADLTESNDIIDLEPGHSGENPAIRRIKRPHLAHEFYLELCAATCITDLLVPLIGPDIRLRAGGKVNMKSAGFGAPVEWHQDWAFYPHTNDDVLAVGIPLDDMDSNNGPLLVLPGTHKGPVYDHHSQGAFCGAIDPTTVDIDFSKVVALTGKAGSMTIHHARLIHGSELNRSDRQRRLLLYEYTAADAWPMAGVEPLSDFDEFNKRVVRGSPTIEPRVEPVPIRMPFPKAPYQGSIYENQRSLSHNYFDHSPEAKRAEAT